MKLLNIEAFINYHLKDLTFNINLFKQNKQAKLKKLNDNGRR